MRVVFCYILLMTDRQLIAVGATIGLILLGFTAWTLYDWKRVAIRQLNLQAFYYAQTCGDLPLGEGTNEQACMDNMVEFMWPDKSMLRNHPAYN